ncbi:hypothetical protein [Streptomyces sp. BPTC-684]|uniref:hypothetical protein n=1 Tax=Streptomyces sp. BPTC-684 TaxID=3043734 RepID=UPI0024B1FEBC|nr:hypothetical protein [Streptomyces sp. BPTC-684]WHM41145.1 hypothetical protein QIY60_32660 [Streptomyces sp. BPTC-684]
MTASIIHFPATPAATASAKTTVPSGPLPGTSSRLARMTVDDLRAQLDGLPGWAEVRIEVGGAHPAIWEAAYGRGFLLLFADDSDPDLLTAFGECTCTEEN